MAEFPMSVSVFARWFTVTALWATEYNRAREAFPAVKKDGCRIFKSFYLVLILSYRLFECLDNFLLKYVFAV